MYYYWSCVNGFEGFGDVVEIVDVVVDDGDFGGGGYDGNGWKLFVVEVFLVSGGVLLWRMSFMMLIIGIC